MLGNVTRASKQVQHPIDIYLLLKNPEIPGTALRLSLLQITRPRG